MRIGFTGSQHGMTRPQARGVYEALLHLKKAGADELHHGSCVGADAEVHGIARYDMTFRIVVHPPSDPKARAWVSEGPGVSVCLPAPYLVRNQAIVDAVDVLVAAPESAREAMRSGTWATIRRARKKGIEIYAFGPAGQRLSLDRLTSEATIAT